MSYPSRFTEFFGPSLWKVMHAVSFNFPENPSDEQRRDYIDFFSSLGPVIPCPSCGMHYRKYVKENPIEADDRNKLAKWVYDLHDDVNKRNGKTSPTFEDVTKDYAGWDLHQHNRYNKLPFDEQARKMADPHLGREVQKVNSNPPDQNNKENMTGDGAKTTRVVIAILATTAVLYMIRKRYKESNKKDQEKK